MKTVYDVLDMIKFNAFTYTNSVGGTENASTDDSKAVVSRFRDMKLERTYGGIVLNAWDDYETGRHYIVQPEQALQDLLAGISQEPDKVYVNEDEVLQGPYPIDMTLVNNPQKKTVTLKTTDGSWTIQVRTEEGKTHVSVVDEKEHSQTDLVLGEPSETQRN